MKVNSVKNVIQVAKYVKMKLNLNVKIAMKGIIQMEHNVQNVSIHVKIVYLKLFAALVFKVQKEDQLLIATVIIIFMMMELMLIVNHALLQEVFAKMITLIFTLLVRMDFIKYKRMENQMIVYNVHLNVKLVLHKTSVMNVLHQIQWEKLHGVNVLQGK